MIAPALGGPAQSPWSASAKATKHPGGKRHGAISAFRGEAGSEADTLGHLGLRQPFGRTAGAEMSKALPSQRYVMGDDRLVVVNEDASWPRLGRRGDRTRSSSPPNGRRSTGSSVRYRTENPPIANRSRRYEALPPSRLRTTPASLTHVGTANHPVEFARPPRWAPYVPSGFCASANTDHVRIGI